jgi:pimeloyl-ACP methyl ester carboxylesterase
MSGTVSPYAEKLAAIPVREHEVVILGSTTHFWEYGDASASTTIVTVHGFRGDHHGLEPVIAQLPDVLDDFRVISPDLPGFGSSTPLTAAKHDVEGYAQWLRRFIDELKPTGRFVLLGHSFGSIVVSAALAGRTQPSDLSPERVVLVNPIGAPALSGPRGVLTRLAVFYYWAGSALPERLGFALLRSRPIVRVMSVQMAKTKQKPLRRWIHEEHDRYFSAFADRRVVLEAFKASVSHDVSEYAASVPEATLLVAAAQDDITPVSAQHRLQTLFPDAKLEVIDGVGHLIHYEVPQTAAELIGDFLIEPARDGEPKVTPQ